MSLVMGGGIHLPSPPLQYLRIIYLVRKFTESRIGSGASQDASNHADRFALLWFTKSRKPTLDTAPLRRVGGGEWSTQGAHPW